MIGWSPHIPVAACRVSDITTAFVEGILGSGICQTPHLVWFRSYEALIQGSMDVKRILCPNRTLLICLKAAHLHIGILPPHRRRLILAPCNLMWPKTTRTSWRTQGRSRRDVRQGLCLTHQPVLSLFQAWPIKSCF